MNEAEQHIRARILLRDALLEARSPFSFPAFSERAAESAVQAVELLIETKMALRERQILDHLTAMLGDPNEPA